MSGGAVGGRQVPPRSGSHQRQYSSDHFLGGGGGGGKWLGSAAVNNPYPSSFAPSQQVEYSRAVRGVNRGTDGELFLSVEPPTSALGSWSSSQRRNGNDCISAGQLSPGILDLHSFDTELLPEIPIPGLYDGVQPFGYAPGRGFDDSDPSFSASKQMSMAQFVGESNPLRSFSADKEKLASVAKIKVVVRKRPLNKKEIAKKEQDNITIEPNSNSLTVHETKLKVDLTEYVEKHEFVFDSVLNEDVSNDEVYRETVEPIVPAIFQRTKATCFAYGQTGSGKTYTMQPLPLKASQDILRLMKDTYCNQGFQLFVSFFEIYGGKLFDLLNDRRKLCMREDGKQKVCIVGLQEHRVSNVDAIGELIEKGNATRSTGTTGANEESSRSHAILQLAIKKSVDNSESKPHRIVGKLSFIDLAGSERGADTTDNDKHTRIEGAEINKSLLALKECIRALDNDQLHIPFRGSKLTEVLRDSFIGDSRTVMISCISPSSGSCEHTLNTLRYADRVKSLSKGSNPGKDLPPALLRESTSLPLSSIVPPVTTLEGSNDEIAIEKKKFGLSKQPRRETSPPFNVDRVPNRKEKVQVATLNGDYFKEQGSKGLTTAEVFDLSSMAYEQGKALRKGKADIYSVSSSEDRAKRVDAPHQKWKDVANDVEDDLSALLQEEEDLVIAHQKQVEETIDIVREEMNLLVKADQPGNQLDDYISKLNAILSQKAAGIVNLQARLARFQRHLNKHNVLLPSPGP
ncbi:kinesin-like protein KIN-13B [Elaeis guineensis]|uniref:kinesin-like protein KIN-13B n=1 Tax=Elaeis guineensis var. tenera TaxID=51953 RepID=UPI003C6D35CE